MLLNNIHTDSKTSNYDLGIAPSYSFVHGINYGIDPTTGIENSEIQSVHNLSNPYLVISDNSMKAELKKLNPAKIIPSGSVSTRSAQQLPLNDQAPIKFQFTKNLAPMSVRTLDPSLDNVATALNDYTEVNASGPDDCYNQAVSTYITNPPGKSYPYTFAAYSGANPKPWAETGSDKVVKSYNCLICGLSEGSSILDDIQSGNTGKVVLELNPLTTYVGTTDPTFTPAPPLSKKYTEFTYILMALAMLIYVFRGIK